MCFRIHVGELPPEDFQLQVGSIRFTSLSPDEPAFEIEDTAVEFNLPLAMLTMSTIARRESSAVQALFGDDSSDDGAVV